MNLVMAINGRVRYKTAGKAGLSIALDKALASGAGQEDIQRRWPQSSRACGFYMPRCSRSDQKLCFLLAA
jgi:hypothetical protein